MFYTLFKPWVKLALFIYFRKLNISHRERIPKGKPVILALNHPTAFIEPCLVDCWQERPMNYLARGDLYVNSPFVRKLYEWCHIVPIFRLDDIGIGGVKTNYESFDKCFEVLAQNKPVLILAEGRTKHEKRLRPLMKGTARIVFGAIEKYKELDVYVLPVGINYTNPDVFRSEVKVDFGEPIRVQDYTGVYRENPAKAVTALTNDLKHRLLERVIHLEHPADDTWTEQLLEIHRNGSAARAFPAISSDPTPLYEEKKLADRINAIAEPAGGSLKKKVEDYTSLLKKAGTTDRGLMDHTSYSLSSALMLGVCWIPFLIGFALNILPIYLGNLFALKKTKTIEFRASVAIVVSMFLYLIYWSVLFVFALVIGEWWIIGLVVAMPFLGYFALLYRDLDIRWKDCQRASVIDDNTEDKLMAMRAELMKV